MRYEDATNRWCKIRTMDTNKVTLIDRNGKVEDLPLMSKPEVAEKIIDRVVRMLGKKR